MKACRRLASPILGVTYLVVTSVVAAQAQGLVVDVAGNVGVGTSAPSDTLHISASNAGITVDSTGGTESVVLRLVRPSGSTTALLESSGSGWAIQNIGNGSLFRVRKVGGTNFDFQSSGNLVVPGNITAGGSCNCSSSRTVKTDIEPLDDREILTRLAALPIFKWRYKADESKVSQVGPMAEDFHETFGLGDPLHISVASASGVSMAAIRGLNQVVEEKTARLEAMVSKKQEEVDALRHANDELEKRLAQVERQIGAERLASR